MTACSILLVEDTPDDEALTLRALRQRDLATNIVVARNGDEALELLIGDEGAELAPLPKVVILDLKLPRCDGLEVLDKLRAQERTRDLPVVIFSSSCAERDIAESYRRGANSYVRKPVDYREFRAAVRAVSDYWVGRNEPPCTESEPGH